MYLGENLILILSPPRCGSTMLQRMLGSHTKILTHPEPHLLTPLAFQGYFHQVEKAAYNHKVAAEAFREFIDFLPNQEEDYLEACRAYCEVLYTGALEQSGKHYFLDKTPNYADTILPFITRLLPRAKFIVLTRHPFAVMSSLAHTFYEGDYDRAYYNRDVLGTFIPPLAHFLRESKVAYARIKYEDLVTDPEKHMRRLLGYLDLDYEGACINFGEQDHITKTYGDPKIGQCTRPVTKSIDAWVKDLANRPDRRKLCELIINRVAPEDLSSYGYPLESLWVPLDEALDHGGIDDEGMSLATLVHAAKWAVIRSAQSIARNIQIGKFIRRVTRNWNALLR